MKPKNLFTHLNAITTQQDLSYWDKLTDTEKKTFQPYMVNRFLSMHKPWIEWVNFLQKYTIGLLSPKNTFKLYMEIIPRGKKWLKYVKGKKSNKYPSWLIELIAKHFETSTKDAEDYLNVIGKDELKNILQMYGTEKKKMKEVKL